MPRLTPIHFNALIKVFRKKGFEITRQRGGHIIMAKTGVARPIVIPAHPTQPAVSVSSIKANLRTAGISHREYFELLADP